MECLNGHTYEQMLKEKQATYPGRATIVKIYPELCPICGGQVIVTVEDFNKIEPKPTNEGV